MCRSDLHTKAGFINLCKAHMNAVIKEVKMWMGGRGMRFLEDGREWILPGLLYTDDLVL